MRLKQCPNSVRILQSEPVIWILVQEHLFVWFTKTMTAGRGVCLRTWIMERISGRWPSRDATKNILVGNKCGQTLNVLITVTRQSSSWKSHNTAALLRLVWGILNAKSSRRSPYAEIKVISGCVPPLTLHYDQSLEVVNIFPPIYLLHMKQSSH